MQARPSPPDVQLVGCPLAAAVVDSTESIRSCVAIACSSAVERRRATASSAP